MALGLPALLTIPPGEMRNHFPITPLSRIPNKFPQPKPAALHRLTGKSHAVWKEPLMHQKSHLVLLELSSKDDWGKGREKEEELSFQHAVQPAGAVERQEGSGGEEQRRLVTGFPGAAKQQSAEGAGSKRGPCPQAVLLNWVCQMQLG